MTTNIQKYLEENKEPFLNELKDFLRIPSVSTDKKFAKDIRKAAEFLQNKLLKIGMDKVDIISTEGHPIVYGEKIINNDLPTILFYGHYDVQPADPYELWESPPFEPVIKEGKIYARGAADDKGQVYMHIIALEAMLANNHLPCNVQLLIEGEEEIGSSSLSKFLQEEGSSMLKKADILVVSDTTIPSINQPAITVGLRGIVTFEVTLSHASKDLHSGAFGGAVENPLQVLCKVIHQLKDQNNKINIPGLYDQVEVLDTEKRKMINKAFEHFESTKKDIGISHFINEADYTPLESATIRPSLEVNGLWGGYIDEGFKTIIPAKAHAKISIRTVPKQKGEEIAKKFVDYFKKCLPSAIKSDIKVTESTLDAIFVNQQSVGIQAAQVALEKIFQKTPIFTYCGASIPIVSLFHKQMGLDSVLMGFGLETDNIHSPNEHFGIENFEKGIKSTIAFYNVFTQKSLQINP